MAGRVLTRRRATIALHWALVLLLMLMVSDGGRFGLVLWAFVAAALVFGTLALWRGLMTRPGPKLTGVARAVHPWQHRALYALAVLVALITAAEALGQVVGPDPDAAQGVLLFAVMLHAIFHLWRHTALRDGALRIITPRALHRHL